MSGPGVVSGLDKLTESAHTISTVHTPIASATEQPQEQNQKPKKLASENVLPPGYAAVDGPDPGEEVSLNHDSVRCLYCDDFYCMAKCLFSLP